MYRLLTERLRLLNWREILFFAALLVVVSLVGGLEMQYPQSKKQHIECATQAEPPFWFCTPVPSYTNS
jgi:hypothetical protein